MSAALAEPPVRKAVRSPSTKTKERDDLPAAVQPAGGAVVDVCDPTVWEWTVEEYLQAGEAGLLQHPRIELIRGQIIMAPPIGPDHTVSTTAFQYRLDGPLSRGRRVHRTDLGIDQPAGAQVDARAGRFSR